MRWLLPLTLLACSDPSNPVATDVSYSQLVAGFDDLESCREATQNEFFNCTHTLTLCSNGGFMIVVTDIINEGRYTVVDDGVLSARLAGAGDAPDRFTVRFTAETIEIPELGGQHPWIDDGTPAESLADSCGALEGRDWW